MPVGGCDEVIPLAVAAAKLKGRLGGVEAAAVERNFVVVQRCSALGGDIDDAGRVLVRFSGTEPLARVMVEGPELAQVEAFASRIARVIERELGGEGG